MKRSQTNEETVRQFLLGDLPEPERAPLEDAFLADATIFEQIEDAENDLVDDYVARRLDEPESRLFERYYLASPENRAKVEAAQFLRHEQRTKKMDAATVAVADRAKVAAGFWHSLQNLFSSGAFVPAAGFAILLCIGGLWLAFREPSSSEMVYSPPPAPVVVPIHPTLQPETNHGPATEQISPSVTPLVQSSSNVSPRETPRAIERKENEPPTPRPKPRETTVTLALVAGLVRGEGGSNRLVLPEDTARVRFTFDLAAAQMYKAIEGRIETVEGALIWSGKINLVGQRVALSVPARLFSNEDYLLIVSGITESAERKDFAQFSFNSERK